MKPTHSGAPFTINIKMIRKQLAVIGRNKSMGPDGVPGKILKLCGETVIPYLVRLLDITVNNATISCYWKRATVVPAYKGGDGPIVTNYRPVSLTLVVCRQILNLSGLQTNRKCHSRLPKVSLGYK
jgi:hypothetical protein